MKATGNGDQPFPSFFITRKTNLKFMKILTILWLLLFAGATSFGQSQTSVNPAWEISVTNPDNYIGIALSSGRIGIMPSEMPFKVNSIVLNNVYEKESELGVSKILNGINFGSLDLSIDGEPVDQTSITNWKQVLNMREGFLETSFIFQQKAEISYRIYALRNMPYVGITDIMVKSLKGKIKLEAAGIMSCPPDFQVLRSTFRILKDNEIRMPLLQTTAKSQFGRHLIASTGSFLFDHEIPQLVPDTISEREHRVTFTRDIQQGSSYNFAWAGAVCTTQDFNDPQSESERMVIFLLRDNKTSAIRKHTQLWADLWEDGDIEVDGDPVAQQDIRLALYHLYSFSRTDSDLSIPPMGFSSRIYNGHIFWDTELWMFPPLLVFNQEIAKSLLNYRFNRLQKARQKAVSYGYAGAMFPWESDDTGEEATPSWALTGTFEHHITADIGIAFWNYYAVTHDKSWLRQTGFPVLKEIADFWISRAEKNPDGSWSVKNVVGANEFAPNVDDNAFTNGSAKAVLEFAVKAAGILGVTADPFWQEVARNLKFNYLQNGVMKEHSHYQGEVIKQADVNLLAYPLGIVTDPVKIRKDLEYYAPRLSSEGPAMGYSILSILYSRLGDKKMAFELFKKSYEPNKRAPFGSLAEAAQFNNTYFATGAGGMLQAVIFGFAGLNITDEGIVRNKSCLPEHWKKLTIKGIGISNETITITNQ